MIDLWTIACVIFLGASLTASAVIDLRTGYLPDQLQILITVVGIGVLIIGSPIGVTWGSAAAGAIGGGVFFAAIRWLLSIVKGREAMGLGDVKLFAVGGLWLGPWALPIVMVIAGLTTLVGVGVMTVIREKTNLQKEIPFGPGLAAGIFVSFVSAAVNVRLFSVTL